MTKEEVYFYHTRFDSRIKDLIKENYYCLMSFKDDHGLSFFIADTKEELVNACLIRLHEIAEYVIFEPYEIKQPEISLEAASNIQDKNIKEAIEAAWNDYNYYLKYNKRIEKEQKMFDYAINERDGVIAFNLLERDFYSDVKFELIEKASPKRVESFYIQ